MVEFRETNVEEFIVQIAGRIAENSAEDYQELFVNEIPL